MAEGIADTTSMFAAEGTACHELAAHCLETGEAPGTFLDMWIDNNAKDGKGRFVRLDDEPTGESAMRFFLVDEEMVDAVEMYVGHIRDLMALDPDAELEVEQRLDISHIHHDIYGTGDAIVYLPATRHLHVPDLKYGKGVAVDAFENKQLGLYTSGAARRYHNRQIAGLTMHIVQPRAPHRDGPIRSYEIDLLDLFHFEDEMKAAAELTADPDAPLAAGEWCRFCKAQPVCPAARGKAIAAAADEFGIVGDAPPPEKLTDERLAEILVEAEYVGDYVKAVQSYAHDRALAGQTVEGFKLVAKRAVRKWRDEAEAKAKMLEMAIEPYRPAKLKSPAMAESGFPGKNAKERGAAMSDFVVKQSSGLNLVPVEDPRPAVKADAASEFGSVD